MLYTSGSTGRPKGAEIGQGALVNLLASMRESPGMSEDDVLCAVTSVSFDIAGLELYLPLLVGARVQLAADDEVSDPERLLAVMARCGATVMQATPATWQLLVERGWKGGALKVLCGGEELTPGLGRALRARASEVWNVYGPTETTIWSTAYRLDRDLERIPIGRPIANTEVYVLDAQLRMPPLGVPGELYIGGAGLARGYLNRPDLTAERFIDHELDGRTRRLYRTGDLARWNSDGQLELRGRTDGQVKLRGFRIELGEIEAALERHEGVTRAVALLSRATGDARLIAYVTGDARAPEELRAHARAWLPDYMVPAAIVHLDAFPLTPNGKIDRRALPDPRGEQPPRAVTGPRTAQERLVAEIWRELLAVDRVGVDDSFFDLGGHSLLLARAHAALEERLQRRFPMVEMLRHPTVARLAAYLDGAGEGGGLSEDAARGLRAGQGRRDELRRRRGR